MKWLAALAMLTALRQGAPAADPWEVAPFHEKVVVKAGWGDGEREFAPLQYWGHGEQERGPGPFCLGPDDSVYIANPVKTEVKVYDRDGAWVRNIRLPSRRQIMDDTVVGEGVMCWFAETLWGYEIWSLDLATGESAQLPAPRDSSFRRGPSGSPLWDAGRLILAPDGPRLLNHPKGVSYRLLEGKAALDVEQQFASRAVGVELRPGLRVLRSRDPGTARNGERFGRGDLLAVAEDGTPERVLVEHAGGIYGHDSSGSFLSSHLLKVGDEAVGYHAIYSPQGKILSRTRRAPRPLRGMVSTGPPFRVSPDGSFFEIHLSKEAVMISRGSR